MSGARARRAAIVVAAIALAACGDPPPPVPVPATAPAEPAPAAPPDLVFDGAPFVARGARWKVARWTQEPATKSPEEDDPAPEVLRAVEASPEDGRPPLRVVVRMMPHYQREGQMQTDLRWPFKNWGKSVRIGDVDEMAKAHYEDWIREACDVIKDFCRPPVESKTGAKAVYGGRAFGSDRLTGKREYRTWYVWSHEAQTYVATFVADATRTSREVLAPRDAAALDLVRSIGYRRTAPK